MKKNGYEFIQLKYDSEITVNIVASILSLLTYQTWGSEYVWPLNKEKMGEWGDSIEVYRSIKKVRSFVDKYHAKN